MRNPARLRLFKAYLSYGLGKRNIYTVENCFLIQGRLAQLYKLRIRPVMVDLTRDQELQALQILCRSKGYLTKENLPYLKQYMYRPGYGRVEFYNLDEPDAPTWITTGHVIHL